ncbi:MAG TPA: metallophosphoesterase [Flavipsychrobacter sp.]|nr:metallophosphoesterase [Flavipsychrobacter sp.]
MKYLLAITFLLIFPFSGRAQEDSSLANEDSIAVRVVVIGDAGQLVDGRQPVIDGVRQLIPLDKKTTVVFVGDNLYSGGLPDDQFANYWQYKAVLDSQVNLVNNTPAKAYFIPGNHDWMNGRPGGWEAVVRQQQYIDQIAKKNIKFYPEGGCPGPVAVNLSDDVVLVMMDSQWWLEKAEKPGVESDCSQKTKDEVLNELEDILSENDRKLVLFAFHHPFKSNGIHGGYYTIKQHIFPLTDFKKNLYIPLPVIGSLYPIARGLFGTPQDLPHPVYQEMKKDVESVVKEHHYTIFLHGHEHTLQYFADSNFNTIISGAGSKHTRVSHGRNAEFVSNSLGFALLEISKNKNVRLSFYTVAPDSFGLAFRKNILNFSSPPPTDSIPATQPIITYRDSVLAPASLRYRKNGMLHRTLLGDNYRKSWSQPVMFKEFNINKEKGGFKITGHGGGKQTKSLTLEDKHGNEWALRTMDKDAEKVLPENLRGGPAQDVVQDMISASFPYAALAVPTLADAAGVLQATPEVFFVPDDPSYGIYRKQFANHIAYLERKDPVPSYIDTKSTQKVMNNIIEENDHVANQRSVLKARLLDIFIGDFDRHYGQWKWAVTDTGQGKLYEPIAKDRDQAFFYSDGVVMDWATRKRLPMLRGFRKKIEKVNDLGYSARNFDRFFLNGLGKQEWENAATELQKEMTDSVIDAAVKHIPKEVYPLIGDTLQMKLKSRRGQLYDAAMKYYRFLARAVNVPGSNKQEVFNVIGTDTGTLVKVYKREKYGDTSMLVYNRLFDPKITKEIRLYGLNGNDRFHIEGKQGIRFRLIGGRGIDTFDVDGNIKTLVYDLNTEPNYLSPGHRTKNRMSADPAVNEYDVNAFEYDVKRFPRINIGFNVEDGLLLGLGFWIRTHGFRNEPYESDNKLTTLFSAFDNAFNVTYRGEFNHLFRNYDLLIRSDFYNPTLNNFFGLGNETVRLPNTNMYYYRARYKYLENNFLIRQRLFYNKVGIAIGPSFYHYWMRSQDNTNRILAHPQDFGYDSSSVYGVKTYVGGLLNINVNNQNSEFYPTRGVDWNTDLQYYAGLNNNSLPLLRLRSDMTIYASLANYERLLAIIRVGGGHIFNDKYEFFQGLNLGANNYLRGFRKNRFTGSSLAYGSVELRYKLFTVKSSVLPGSFGVLGFDDIGRVWQKGENSHKWHNAFGGGIYYLPFDLVSIAATVASSEEETLFNFSVGTKLSFYF